MNHNLINQWLENITPQEDELVEFGRFIQLYFLLNNYFCEWFDQGKYSKEDNKCSKEDKKRMTEKLPEHIEEKWEELDPSIVTELRNIHQNTLAYMEQILNGAFFASVEEHDILFTELILVRDYHYKSKSDVLLFKHLNQSYQNDNKELAALLIKSTLQIIYSVRNNFYHGGKKMQGSSILKGQTELLSRLNFIIIKILKLITCINPALFNEETDKHLEELMSNYSDLEPGNDISLPDLPRNPDSIQIEGDAQQYANHIMLMNWLDSNWDINKTEVIKIAKRIRFLTYKCIEQYIKKRRQNNQEGKIKIGLMDIDSYSYGYYGLSRYEIDLFRGLNIKKWKKEKTRKLLNSISAIIYYFDNTNYGPEFKLYFNNLKEKIENINTHNLARLNSEIKRDLIDSLKKINENDEINQWELDQANIYFTFAYNFIVLEKINKSIRRIFLTPSKGTIIEAIKMIEEYLDIDFEDEDGQNISDYKGLYDNLIKERHNIFHGNSSTQINEEKIKRHNESVKKFITQIKNWISVI